MSCVYFVYCALRVVRCVALRLSRAVGGETQEHPFWAVVRRGRGVVAGT